MLKDRVYDKPEHRNTMEGILYRMRTGCPWRDVPESFGDWSAIYRRFNLWSKKGILMRLGGDIGTQDVSRVLRVPYTKNYKPNCEPKDVTIL